MNLSERTKEIDRKEKIHGSLLSTIFISFFFLVCYEKCKHKNRGPFITRFSSIRPNNIFSLNCHRYSSRHQPSFPSISTYISLVFQRWNSNLCYLREIKNCRILWRSQVSKNTMRLWRKYLKSTIKHKISYCTSEFFKLLHVWSNWNAMYIMVY